MQAIRAPRPGGHVGYVGVTHDVNLPELLLDEDIAATAKTPQ